MKVQALIDQLQAAYSPDDELAVAYWDKNTVAAYAGIAEGYGITDTTWRGVIEDYEDGEWAWQSMAADTFVDILEGR